MMCKLIKWSEFDQLISTRDGRHKEEWATSLVVDVSGNMYIFHMYEGGAGGAGKTYLEFPICGTCSLVCIV